MWLLSTDRAELHYFARNFDAVGGYAILSHTWVGEEQTFQQVQAIRKRCCRSGTNPRDVAHAKIRNCCLLAEQHGYRWVWIDSCCIDKTSSSELSEAVNSMYQWYQEAEVCYAYLADVPDDCVLAAPASAFRTSRWHTRGWTLQELVAPDAVLFLSADWRELGERAALAPLLQEITRVPVQVLTGEARPARYSVCLRMFWAAERRTTRVEDEAYCLMGLFGVSMPANYGEGRRAFVRLQREIMLRDPDMSLFAFGHRLRPGDAVTLHPEEEPGTSWMYLMADSPRVFDHRFHYIPDLEPSARQSYPPPQDSTTAGPFDDVELPRATATSYGVELRLPIYEADGITIAVMLCESGGRHFGLFLTRDGEGQDPKRPRYFTGCHYSQPDTGSARYLARLADLGDDLYNLTFNGKPVKAAWRTVYVVPTPSDPDTVGSTTAPSLIVNCSPASHFRVPRWLISRLTALEFEVTQIGDSQAVQVLKLSNPRDADIILLLGACAPARHADVDAAQPADVFLWARAEVLPFFDENAFEPAHDCAMDHFDAAAWAACVRVFGDAERGVRLAFTPSARAPANVLVVHLELCGRVFEQMLREADVSFPSLADLEKLKERPRPCVAPGDAVAPRRSRTLAQVGSPSTGSSSSAQASPGPSSSSSASSHT